MNFDRAKIKLYICTRKTAIWRGSSGGYPPVPNGTFGQGAQEFKVMAKQSWI